MKTTMPTRSFPCEQCRESHFAHIKAPSFPKERCVSSPQGTHGALESRSSQDCLQEQPCSRILSQWPEAAGSCLLPPHALLHGNPSVHTGEIRGEERGIVAASSAHAQQAPGNPCRARAAPQHLSPSINSIQRLDRLHVNPKSPTWQLAEAPSTVNPHWSLPELHHGWVKNSWGSMSEEEAVPLDTFLSQSSQMSSPYHPFLPSSGF